jgi:hypothetical protein
LNSSKVREDGLYQTEKLTDYYLRMKEDPATRQQWPEYVGDNNARAEEFVRQNLRVMITYTSSPRVRGEDLAN